MATTRPSSPSSGPSPWTASPTRSSARGRWPSWRSRPGRSLVGWWADWKLLLVAAPPEPLPKRAPAQGRRRGAERSKSLQGQLRLNPSPPRRSKLRTRARPSTAPWQPASQVPATRALAPDPTGRRASRRLVLMQALTPRALASPRSWRFPRPSPTTAPTTPSPPSAPVPSPGATRPRWSSRPRSPPSTRPPSRARPSPRPRWLTAARTSPPTTACSSMPTKHASCSFPRASRAPPASPRRRRGCSRTPSRIRAARAPPPWARAAQPISRGMVAYTIRPAPWLGPRRSPRGPPPPAMPGFCPQPPLAKRLPAEAPATSPSRTSRGRPSTR